MKTRSLILCVLAAGSLAFGQTDSDFDATRYVDHIRFLASPELRGRATGSPELEKAAQYIEQHYRALKLKPAPGATGYLQPFQVTTSAKLGPRITSK